MDRWPWPGNLRTRSFVLNGVMTLPPPGTRGSNARGANGFCSWTTTNGSTTFPKSSISSKLRTAGTIPAFTRYATTRTAAAGFMWTATWSAWCAAVAHFALRIGSMSTWSAQCRALRPLKPLYTITATCSVARRLLKSTASGISGPLRSYWRKGRAICAPSCSWCRSICAAMNM